MKWERSIETFCRWSLFYDLYIKMTVFGELIRHADDDIQTSKRGPQNLLDLLPAEFTIKDVQHVRSLKGMPTDIGKCSGMIRQWVCRKYVLQMTDDSFKKSNKYVTKRNS